MMNNKLFNICNNCGISGHAFHNCKHPITSIGIIIFRMYDNNIQYLMIKRKHSLGFVEFMRGKYPLHNYEYLINVFNEMSKYERELIKKSTFEELWTYLWGEQVGIQYRGEERTSKDKFDALTTGVDSSQEYNLEKILNESHSNWEDTEWGFPKGRRNYQEKDLSCALREFEEETGFVRSDVRLNQNIIPDEEIFTGSNMKSYKHKYFVGHIDSSIEPSNSFQETEVSEVSWLKYDECVQHIRPYNLEKINILTKLNITLQQYRLY